MVSWSLETLLLALVVIASLSAIYVAVKAFQASPKWGVVFFFGPLLFYGASLYVGWLLAGLLVFATQIWFVKQPYNWKTWGRIYVYVVICWAGATAIRAQDHGWFPASWMGTAAPAQQAGAPVSDPTATESFVGVEGGRIWYRRSGSGAGTPLVLVHGGPGAGSFALKPLEALGDERVVVRYDQLGAGRSDPAADTALFTIARYVGELDSLRASLGLERMHLLGHGWGAVIAHEYERAHRERVASLILASPALDMPAWIRHTRGLLLTLSETDQQSVASAESVGDYDSPDYQAALRSYADRYVSLRPADSDADSSQRSMGKDAYYHLWGASDFTITGALRRYDATRRLRATRVPTLFTVGQFDQADTATVRRLASATRGARYVIVPDAAHMTAWDNRDEMLRVVREFLRSVETPPAADSAARPDSGAR